jgi:hypothetical protein
MSQVLTKQTDNFSAIEAVILQGDLSRLTSEQRGQYVAKICEVMGLNPLTKPFEFMMLNGKLVCYAGKNCAEQLRMIHDVSLKVVARDKIDDVYVVTVDATIPSGRIDSSTGAVSLAGLKGLELANAMMKAETKAKRRVTLSICGLGMLDETEEVDTDSNDRKGFVEPGNGEQKEGYHFPAIAGSIAMKHIDSVSTDQLKGLMNKIDEQYKDKPPKYDGQPLPPKTKEMYDITHAEILKREGVVIETPESEEGSFLNF